MRQPPPSSTLFPYTTLFRSELHVRREDEEADLGELLADRSRRVEPLGRVRRRHANVHDRELGLVLADELEKLGGVARLSDDRSEEHTSELQSRRDLVCRLLL